MSFKTLFPVRFVKSAVRSKPSINSLWLLVVLLLPFIFCNIATSSEHLIRYGNSSITLFAAIVRNERQVQCVASAFVHEVLIGEIATQSPADVWTGGTVTIIYLLN